MARSLTSRFEEPGPKRILSLDGGGVKGILTLGMLKALESELARRAGHKAFVLSDYYDLIGGTSTGAIIASGLALGMKVDDLIEMYLELGPRVFGRQIGDGGLFRSKFDPKALRTALAGVLGRRTLGSPDLRTGLALHAKRIDTGSPWVLTNNPKSKYFDPENPSPDVVANKKYLLIDLVQASAAAPTFFDEVLIAIARDDKGRPTQTGYFVDGAVSGNNNPSMSLMLLALMPGYGFNWRSGAQNLMMTSFGTGLRRPEIQGEQFRGLPPGFRGVHSLKSMIYDTQIQGITLLQALSEPQMPWRINSEIEDMGGQRITPEPLLDYQRIDVVLDLKVEDKPNSIEKLLGKTIAAARIEALDDMANGKPANMELLLDIGLAAGTKFVGERYPSSAFDPSDWTSWSLAS